MKNKIVSREKLQTIVEQLKTKGQNVISTSGCFDILHAGHVTYLEKAKSKGDILIILLNSDDSVRRIKGEERPIVPQSERALVVAGLGCVDYVCTFDESTPCVLLGQIKPSVFIKGADYEKVHIPEEDVMAAIGGRVEYISFVDGCSSTNIIEKIKRLKDK